jgi:hypothetical protein
MSSIKSYDTYCKTYMPKEKRHGKIYKYNRETGQMEEITSRPEFRRNLNADVRDEIPMRPERNTNPTDPDAFR